MTRALVIDDDDIAREQMISILRSAGYEAFSLPSPIGATQLILRAEIEVVVLDVMLPALSGDQLAKMLRSNPRILRLGIVLVSRSNIDELENLTLDGPHRHGCQIEHNETSVACHEHKSALVGNSKCGQQVCAQKPDESERSEEAKLVKVRHE